MNTTPNSVLKTLLWTSVLAGFLGFHSSANAQDLAVSAGAGFPDVVSKGDDWSVSVTARNLGGETISDVQLIGTPQGGFGNTTMTIDNSGSFSCNKQVTVFGTSFVCSGSFSGSESTTVSVRLDTRNVDTVPAIKWEISSASIPDPDTSNNADTATVPAYFRCDAGDFRGKLNARVSLSGSVSPGNEVVATVTHDQYPDDGRPCRYIGPGVQPTSSVDGLSGFRGTLNLNSFYFSATTATGDTVLTGVNWIQSVSDLTAPNGHSCGAAKVDPSSPIVSLNCNWTGNPDADFTINSSHTTFSGDLRLRASLDVSPNLKPGEAWDWFDSCEGSASITQRACTSSSGTVVNCSSPSATNSKTISKSFGASNVCRSGGSPVRVRENAFSVQKFASPSQITPTDRARFLINVTNNGTVDQTNVTATDTLPSGTTVSSVNAPGWSCSGTSGTMTCAMANPLPVGNSTSIELFLNLPAGASSGDSFTNCVDVSSSEAFTASDCGTVAVSDPNADLSISKTGPSSVNAAETFSYSFTVSNAGPAGANGITFADTLPNGVTFISASGSAGSCSVSGQTITCTQSPLAAGANRSFTISVTAPTAGGSINNCASVSSSTNDPDSGNNSNCHSTVVIPLADLSISKTGPSSVNARDSISYSLAVSNAGPSSATSVTVTDTLPAGTSFVSASATSGWSCSASGETVTCTRTSLSAGGSGSITINATAPDDGGTINNCASVSSNTNDSDSSNNGNCHSTSVAAQADLSLAKTGPATVDAGSSFDYQIAVENLGPSSAANATVSDTLPSEVTFESASGAGWSCSASGGTVTCSATSVGVGSASPIMISVRAPDGGASLNNCASAGSDATDPDSSNNSDCQSTTVTPVADLSLSKTGPAEVNATEQFVYTLEATNTGPSTAQNVVVVDSLPAAVQFVSVASSDFTCAESSGTVSCSNTTLASGVTGTVQITAQAPDQGMSLDNCASVSSDTTDPTGGNNSACHATTVNAVADLTLTKSGPGTAKAGSAYSYSLSVANLGPSAASNVTFTDTLPAGVSVDAVSSAAFACSVSGNDVTCSTSSFPDGTSDLITIDVTAPAEASSITNCASITSSDIDPDTGNNQDCQATDITPVADLGISKAVSQDPVPADTNYNYLLTVTNAGPSTATDVVVDDVLPSQATFVGVSADSPLTCAESSGTIACSAASVAPGTYGIVITVQAPLERATLTNAATVSSSVEDPDSANNADSVTHSIAPQADLVTTKTASVSEVLVNEPLSYTITLENLGPSTAENVELVDTLPPEFIFGSISADLPLTCSGTTCTAASLPVGSYTVTIDGTAPDEDASLTNICNVTASTSDPNPNPACEATTSVVTEAAVRVSKVSTNTEIRAAEEVEYEVTVSNEGPTYAMNPEIRDVLPAGMELISVSAPPPLTCTSDPVEPVCSANRLDPGSYVVTLVARAPDEPGQIDNFSVFDSPTRNPLPEPPEDNDVRNVRAVADLAVTKAASASEVFAGDSFDYTITVEQLGPSTATDVTVDDTLPAGFTMDSIVADAPFACTGSTCSASSLAVGTYTITISGTAPEETGEIINAVSISGPDDDPDPTNNDDQVPVTVSPQADLQVTKQTLTTDIFAGEPVDYRITVEQLGPSDAPNVEVVDTLPADSSFISASSATFTCAEGFGVVTCSAAALAPGTYTIDLQIQAPDEGGPIINGVTVSSDIHDPAPDNDDDSTTNNVTPRSDIEISKQAQDGAGNPVTEIGAGLPLFYVITVDQQGPSTATDVTVSDTLPANVTFVDVSAPAAFACSESVGTVDCLASSLAVGAHEIIIETTAPDDPGPIENTCTIGSATDDPTPPGAGDCADGGVNVTPRADVEIAKALQDPSGNLITEIRATEPMQWEVTVSNNGPSTAENVVFDDDVPGEFSVTGATASTGSCTVSGNSVSCPLGDLIAGDSETIIIEATAPADSGTFENVCTFTSDTPDPVVTDCADGGLNVLGVVDLEMVKSAAIEVDNNGSPSLVEVTEVDASSEFSYLLRVNNAGPSTAKDVVVTDQLPTDVTFVAATGFDDCVEDAGLVTCQIAEIPAGDFAFARIRVTAPQFVTTLDNSADVATATIEEGGLPNTAAISTDVTETPAIGLAKAQTMVEHLGGGEFRSSVLFTIANYGNVPLSSVQMTDSFADAFPASVSWFVEDVSVSGDLTELNPAYDGDLDVNLLSGAETLPVGGEASVRVDVRYIPDLETGPFLNQATVNGFSTLDVEVQDDSTNGLDPNPDSTHPNNHSEPTPIQFTEDPALGLAKWVEDRVFLDNGQQRIDLAIRLDNIGNVPLTNVQVIDNLVFTFTPEDQVRQRSVGGNFSNEEIILKDVVDIRIEGDLASVNPNYNGVLDTNLLTGIDSLPVGGSAIVRFGMIVEPEPDDFGPFFNRALGSGWSPAGTRVEDLSQDGFDVNPSESGDPTDDNDPTPIWAIRADVAVSKQQTAISPQPGESLVWEVTATNLGPDTAHQVEITDMLPANSPLEGVGEGAFTCTSGPEAVTCVIDQLPVGASESFTVRTTAPDDGTNVVNTCEAGTLTPDPDLTNNTCSAESLVEAEASVRMTKTVAGPVYLGQPFDYILTVANEGPSPAEDVLVFDDLPAGLEFVGVAADLPFSCNAADGEVLCQAGQLPVGTYEITIGVIAPSQPGPITNVCVLESATTNPAESTNDCSVTIEPDDSADITMSKRSDPPVIAPNQTFRWIIDVNNAGPSAAQDVVVVDRVPAAATVLRATADAPFSCQVSGNDVTCQGDTLPVGAFSIWIEAQAPAEPQSLRNTCVLESGTHTPGSLDGCDTEVAVDNDAAIITTVEASRNSAFVGNRFDYTINVDNFGDVGIPNLEMVIDAAGPAALDLLSSNHQCGENSSGEFVCRAELPSPGRSTHIATLTFVGDRPGLHSLTATARAVDMEINGSSRVTDSANVTVMAQPIEADMALTLSGPASVAPSASFEYGLTVRNSGPERADNVLVETALPPSVTFMNAAGNGWSCSHNAGVVDCARASMAAGATSSISISVNAPSVTGQLEACADVNSSTDDPNLGNNGDCHITDVRQSAGGPPFGPNGEVRPIPVNNPIALLVLVMLMMIGGGVLISRRPDLG